MSNNLENNKERKKNSLMIDQENYSKFYQYAEMCLREKDFESARRAIICACGLLLKIANNTDDQSNKDSIKSKIFKLIDVFSNSSNENLDKLLCTISEENMGCDFDTKINQESVKAIIQNYEMEKKESNITFDDVAGLKEVKEFVNRYIINPTKYPDIYSKYKKRQGGGFLLYGLPGTGKTMIAKAIANEIKAKFYPIKCSDLVCKWFGETEQRIAKLFDEAKQQKLSIIFFDEFEALGQSRDDTEGGMKMVVPELLSQMQGFDSKRNVIVMAASNRPWDIDSAFLRPGRFSRSIYVDLPDEESRKIIIERALKGVPIDKKIKIDDLVKVTELYNGADVEEFCDYAKNFAIEREIQTGKTSKITLQDIERTKLEVNSSIDIKDYEVMKKYMSNIRSWPSARIN